MRTLEKGLDEKRYSRTLNVPVLAFAAHIPTVKFLVHGNILGLCRIYLVLRGM